MGVHRIYREQVIRKDILTLWDFISSPENLNEITPPDMGFIIKSRPKGKMYPGMIITYKVSPFLGIKMNWVTEITHVKDLEYFVDEQRVGPYRLWHHEHILEPHPDGVLMKDIVHYKVPGGPFGDLLNALFISGKLKRIFNFRFQKMEALFNL